MPSSPPESPCLLCKAPTPAHPDDTTPICDRPECQRRWEEYVITAAFMSGELDHTIPELTEEEPDG